MKTYKKLKILQYKEGYSYPIFKDVLIDSESNYNQSLLEREVDKLWTTQKDYESIVKYVVYGVVGLIVLFLIMKFLGVNG